RIVDLQEVLEAGKGGSREASKPASPADRSGSVQQAPPNAPIGTSAARAVDPGPPLPPPIRPGSPPSLEAVRASWPAVIAAMRAQSRFLGEALAAGEPVALEPPWLSLKMAEPNPLLAERLREEAVKVEEVLSRSLGQPVRLRITSGEPGESAPPAKGRRISESSLKAERLREFRAKDPALDTAADALDLEIVD
ncbi:MAG TPA: hypothetical protein VFU40_04450, partial [Gemmatimonadales bacterium]|nr:hypothetical protein [Gemmatimonadales bacterium]